MYFSTPLSPPLGWDASLLQGSVSILSRCPNISPVPILYSGERHCEINALFTRIRQRIQIFLNSLSRVEKNKSATNPTTCGRVNPDIFESNDVAKSCPVSHRTIKPIWRHNSDKEQICCHYRALWRVLWRHLIAKKPWMLQWIRVPSDACGQPNSIWIRYVWTGKFFNPERKSRGFKKSGYVWKGPKCLNPRRLSHLREHKQCLNPRPWLYQWKSKN